MAELVGIVMGPVFREVLIGQGGNLRRYFLPDQALIRWGEHSTS